MPSKNIQIFDIQEIQNFSLEDPEGIAVIMPCTDTEMGLKTAEVLHRRAGITCNILVVHDTLRQGFIKTLNQTATRISAKYIVYLAQDAWPGRGWLKCAYNTLEKTGKGLLAFNDGKWSGRIAAFGMVRTDWANKLYGGDIFYSGYKSHKADNELTVLARAQEMHVYNPECTLVEYDPNKDFGGSNPKDKRIFKNRFMKGFDGQVPFEELQKFAKDYKVDMKEQLTNNESQITNHRSQTTESGVSVIILTKDDPNNLDNLLKSFFQTNTYSPVEILVIDHGDSFQITDNNSQLTTRDVISKYVTHGFVRLLKRDQNSSFADSCNYGVAKARFPYLLFAKNKSIYNFDILHNAIKDLNIQSVAVEFYLKNGYSSPGKRNVFNFQPCNFSSKWNERIEWNDYINSFISKDHKEFILCCKFNYIREGKHKKRVNSYHIPEKIFKRSKKTSAKHQEKIKKREKQAISDKFYLRAKADQKPISAADGLNFHNLFQRALFSPEIRIPFDEKEEYFVKFLKSNTEYLVRKYKDYQQSVLVSIVMPTFNREHCIGKAIDSVLEQYYSNWELIVVDDCSNDNTENVVQTYTDPRIKYQRISHNLGCAEARNVALKDASGDFIAYLDSDNWMDPAFLLVLVNELLQHPYFEMVYCAQMAYRLDGQELIERFVRFAPFQRSMLENRNYIDLNAILHKRNVLKNHGSFHPEMRRLVDWELILRITEEKNPKPVAALLSNYVYSDDNNQVTRTNSLQESLSYIDKVRYGSALSKLLNQNTLSGLETIYCLPYPIRKPDIKRLVSIIIPNYETLEYLDICIDSIEKFTNMNTVELIIIDNKSSEQVIQYLKKLKNSGRAKVVLNNVNMGFTYAANQGIELSTPGSDVVLLNNDAAVTSGWLDALQCVMEDYPDAALVIPRQTVPSNEPSIKIHRPEQRSNVESDINISCHHANVKDVSFDEVKGYMELSFAPFFCVYIPRKTIETVGPLDTVNGPHYRSDRLYCDLIAQCGLGPILYTPHSKIYHFVQKATSELKKLDPSGYDAIFVRNDWKCIQQNAATKGTKPAKKQRGDTNVDFLCTSGLLDETWYQRFVIDSLSEWKCASEHYIKVGAKQGIMPNPIFDGDWYLRRYPDLARNIINPLVHYIRAGVQEGRDPHPLFDSDWYSNMNPEVEKKNLNPLKHYIMQGAAEGLKPHFEFDTKWYAKTQQDDTEGGGNPLGHYIAVGMDRGLKPNPYFSEERIRFVQNAVSDEKYSVFGVAEYGPIDTVLEWDKPPAKKIWYLPTVCVHLHLYHIEMADHFINLFGSMNCKFTLLMSVPEKESPSEWASFFSGRIGNLESVSVSAVKNRGRDVMPWVVTFREQIRRFDLMLHVHSKKTEHNIAHRLWRDFLEHCMLGGKSITDQILEKFSNDPEIGLIYPAYFGTLVAQPHYQGNREIMQGLWKRLSKTELPKICLNFPAGSFFWARTKALAPIFDLNLKVSDFPKESGQIDGTLAHAIERLVGFVPKLMGMKKLCTTVDVASHLVQPSGARPFGTNDELEFSKARLDWLQAKNSKR